MPSRLFRFSHHRNLCLTFCFSPLSTPESVYVTRNQPWQTQSAKLSAKVHRFQATSSVFTAVTSQLWSVGQRLTQYHTWWVFHLFFRFVPLIPHCHFIAANVLWNVNLQFRYNTSRLDIFLSKYHEILKCPSRYLHLPSLSWAFSLGDTQPSARVSPFCDQSNLSRS